MSSVFRLERLGGRFCGDEAGRRIVHDDFLGWLHFCLTGESQPIRLPTHPAFIDNLVGGKDLTGGMTPLVGDRHVMVIGILAGVEMTQDQQNYAEGGNRQRMADALSESLGQQLGGTMEEMLSRNMNIAPTLEIRPGYRLNVMLVKDLVFHGPYRGFDYAGGGGR